MAALEQQVQLTFDVGGDAPDTAILRLSGGVILDREVQKGTEVHLVVSGMDGEVIGNAWWRLDLEDGRVVSVMFKDRIGEAGEVVAVERIHGLKVS